MEKEEIEEKINEEEKSKKGKFFINLFLLVAVIIVGLFFYSKYVGPKGLIVKEYRVESNILTQNLSGIKIVHFSDLFYKSTVDEEDLKSLVNKINTLKPDIVVFTGDLVNPSIKINEKDKQLLIDSLSSIYSKIGKYCIYGDNDFSLNDYEEIMTNSKFNILNNSYDEIFYKDNNSMYIVGIPSSIKETVKTDESFEFYDDNERKYTIVLVHDGNTIKYLDESNYEVDLVLGGHSLNGSVVLPIYGGVFKEKSIHKYYNEYYEKGITKIFISSGIGTNKYYYRLNNKPSINLYRLKAQS